MREGICSPSSAASSASNAAISSSTDYSVPALAASSAIRLAFAAATFAFLEATVSKKASYFS